MLIAAWIIRDLAAGNGSESVFIGVFTSQELADDKIREECKRLGISTDGASTMEIHPNVVIL